MGKGDIKTKRGKIANKSYGARRPKKGKKVVAAKKATSKAKTKTKAPAKKAAAKKTAKKE